MLVVKNMIYARHGLLIEDCPIVISRRRVANALPIRRSILEVNLFDITRVKISADKNKWLQGGNEPLVIKELDRKVNRSFVQVGSRHCFGIWLQFSSFK